MPGPKPKYPVELTTEEEEELRRLARSHKTSQVKAMRARILLAAYEPSTREVVLQRVREVIEGVAAACGASAELEITPLTPAVINDAQVAEVARQAAEAVLGPECVTSGERTMGSEDAAFLMQEVPGCYLFLGAANPGKGLTASHHNPRFDFDEEALVLGTAILAQAAAFYLLR